MANDRERSGVSARRLIGVLAALLTLAALAPTASADTQHDLEQARAELNHLKDDIAAKQALLNQLSAQVGELAMRIDDHQAVYDEITAQLQETRARIDEADQRYQDLQGQLNERVRQTYMEGPASSFEFLLGASSFTDLSDRIEYVDALTQNDSDLANQVQNLRNDLVAQRKDQERLQARQASILKGLEADKAQLDAQFAQQKDLFDQLQADKAKAEDLVKKLYKKRQAELAALASISPTGHISGSNPFSYCPVGQPRAVYDGFGAPRYAGGYHPHAGNDIVAPGGTPIYAPFDGTARSSYNTLGGNSEYVYGASGYVYNAHLSAYSSLSNGFVHAGDVIGYVGNTGDAQGGVTHDHFEWHPNVIPSNWPASAYGYTVIGTAVNPYPLLAEVCF